MTTEEALKGMLKNHFDYEESNDSWGSDCCGCGVTDEVKAILEFVKEREDKVREEHDCFEVVNSYTHGDNQ